MDWKLALTTFGAVFLAELGDKTQLATMAFSAAGRSPWAVFVGSACALVTTSAIAAFAGGAVARVVSPHLLTRIAGVAFLAVGIWVLWSSRQSG
jgi:putative Ca2+/H+ antiporter (TMEM165/GDT1 family)